mgnify:FL=1
MNPYKTLGVSESATQEEIRAAYLDLVKKYHPDRYTDNPLKELANEKLKEINTAYELLTKRNEASRSSANWEESFGGTYSGSGSSYSGPEASQFVRARSFISQNNLESAKQILESISARNAEWYYLYGIIYLRQGWYDKAQEYLARAYEKEPGNPEYRNAYAAIKNAGNPFGRNPSRGYAGGYNDGCTGCDLCTSLLCADCCCNMMGGRLCC